ncbi:MAG: alpha-galactosidase, partial [Lentisphaeria bacterium]|nr:alpha-galactosidase [Lentisphaeria bacterium]
CDYPGGYGLAPGQTMTSEIFAIGFYPDGHTALEQWADTVMAVNALQPPKFRPSGYNSWYAYRLEISEELLLENARIMRRRWGALGLDVMQIDHGWQDRDIVGNWVPNKRFPHGLPWLSEQLGTLGFRLGLWLSVANISEFAPFFKKHPEALMQNPDGSPVVSAKRWTWKPHGRTFSLDPTHPAGAAFYEDTGRALRSYGCVYAKNDFQSNLLRTNVVVHDTETVRGVPVYRRGMDLLRKGMGSEMAYHACNGALNVIAGACDVAWTHRDIGNPRGDWASLRLFVNELCCRYHVSGKFYWSDPDYLQVGQGSLNEKQVRMAISALAGGPTFICDRLPELGEDTLALISKCLPGYGKVARPLDLFTHPGYPQVWDLPVETAWGEWHVVGVFNLDEQAQRICLDLQQLELETGRPHAVYD